MQICLEAMFFYRELIDIIDGEIERDQRTPVLRVQYQKHWYAIEELVDRIRVIAFIGFDHDPMEMSGDVVTDKDERLYGLPVLSDGQYWTCGRWVALVLAEVLLPKVQLIQTTVEGAFFRRTTASFDRLPAPHRDWGERGAVPHLRLRYAGRWYTPEDLSTMGGRVIQILGDIDPYALTYERVRGKYAVFGLPEPTRDILEHDRHGWGMTERSVVVLVEVPATLGQQP